MAKHLGNLDMTGFKLEDLLNTDGLTFDIGNEFNENDDDEEFSYSSNVQFSNEEMLNMLNLNGFDDEDDEYDNEGSVSLCGISFSKLKAKMTSITPDQKVLKLVKHKGVGEVVPINAQVTINYTGHFELRDEPFDSSYASGKPRRLRLGQGHIIPGLEIGINSMQKHETAIFLIHPDLAYKSVGCPPRIPPNEEVVFVVQLIDYVDDGAADTYQDLEPEYKKSYKHIKKPVEHKLASAKDYCAQNNIKQGVKQYMQAIEWLENVKLEDSLEEEEMNKNLSKAYTNLGICYNKLGSPRRACMACIRVPIPTAKTHYNFGKALLSLGEYEQALEMFYKAYKLQPQNEAVIKALQETNAKQRKYQEIEKRFSKNCFKFEKKQTKVSEFQKVMREFCETIINDNSQSRLVIPEGLTEEELQIVRAEAATLGLTTVTSSRYGKDVVYLQKGRM